MPHLTQPAPPIAAILISLAVAFAAWRGRSLSTSGAVAACIVGTLALLAGWGNGALLLAWFACAAALSALGKRQKADTVQDIVSKAHARDLQQVFANGGVFAIASVGVIIARMQRTHAAAGGVVDSMKWDHWLFVCSVAAAGALAASGADTWATEIGTLYGKAPWSLRLRKRVPAGTSGAVTLEGSAAMLLGAAAIALLGIKLSVWNSAPSHALIFLAIFLGGVSGALTDTLVGAWVQQRRWCPACQVSTEQAMHRCGTATSQIGGVRTLDNDGVNFLCTIVGAAIATAVALA